VFSGRLRSHRSTDALDDVVEIERVDVEFNFPAFRFLENRKSLSNRSRRGRRSLAAMPGSRVVGAQGGPSSSSAMPMDCRSWAANLVAIVWREIRSWARLACSASRWAICSPSLIRVEFGGPRLDAAFEVLFAIAPLLGHFVETRFPSWAEFFVVGAIATQSVVLASGDATCGCRTFSNGAVNLRATSKGGECS